MRPGVGLAVVLFLAVVTFASAQTVPATKRVHVEVGNSSDVFGSRTQFCEAVARVFLAQNASTAQAYCNVSLNQEALAPEFFVVREKLVTARFSLSTSALASDWYDVKGPLTTQLLATGFFVDQYAVVNLVWEVWDRQPALITYAVVSSVACVVFTAALVFFTR